LGLSLRNPHFSACISDDLLGFHCIQPTYSKNTLKICVQICVTLRIFFIPRTSPLIHALMLWNSTIFVTKSLLCGCGPVTCQAWKSKSPITPFRMARRWPACCLFDMRLDQKWSVKWPRPSPANTAIPDQFHTGRPEYCRPIEFWNHYGPLRQGQRTNCVYWHLNHFSGHLCQIRQWCLGLTTVRWFDHAQPKMRDTTVLWRQRRYPQFHYRWNSWIALVSVIKYIPRWRFFAVKRLHVSWHDVMPKIRQRILRRAIRSFWFDASAECWVLILSNAYGGLQ